jgi:hypothetical protein
MGFCKNGTPYSSPFLTPKFAKSLILSLSCFICILFNMIAAFFDTLSFMLFPGLFSFGYVIAIVCHKAISSTVCIAVEWRGLWFERLY